MGRMRHRVVNVSLDDGNEIRIVDAPSSDPIRNLTITVAPLYDGPLLPAGAGNLVCKVYYGGGYAQPEVAYTGAYETGVQQGATVNLAAASALPQRIFTDDEICMPDRWRDGTTVRECNDLARALHLYNNTGGGFTLRCRVMFDSEELNEAI